MVITCFVSQREFFVVHHKIKILYILLSTYFTLARCRHNFDYMDIGVKFERLLTLFKETK